MTAKKTTILALFDVDGTLTIPRGEATEDMIQFLATLKGRITTGVVGGSDMPKQMEQLGPKTLELFDYNFAENGLVAYKQGKELAKTSIADHLGNDKIKRIINWVLRYLSEVDIPVKRGTFIEYRSGMMNISPIGRNCSREERNDFEAYDKEHGIRSAMVEAMRKEFADYDLTYSIGGQISFDLFPRGWDKTYCLRYLPEEEFQEVHFFGDKTFPGGNDYEIFEHPRTQGHCVTGPEHTKELCQKLFLSDSAA
jgi:phosphomannomutase